VRTSSAGKSAKKVAKVRLSDGEPPGLSILQADEVHVLALHALLNAALHARDELRV